MNPWKLERGWRVLANLKNGDGLLGKVEDLNRHAFFLVDAELVLKDGRQPMDGVAVVPNDSVAWLQVLGR